MIDYSIIDASIKHYENYGFSRIESPWTVTPNVSKITSPKNVSLNIIESKNKCLVGSAEQSFLYLMIKGFINKGLYQSVTPCFREESFDTIHTKYFMKNELIYIGEENKLKFIIDTALLFFRQYLPDAVVIKTEIGFDIVSGDYELGSYGNRQHEYLKWTYGTGVAEPRLSQIIKIKNNGVS